MESSTARIIVVVLIATMFISVFGSIATLNKFGGFKALTGAWGSGTATYGSTNLTITSQTIINFTTQNITFGSGYVTAGATACIMDSIGTTSAGCSGFTSSLSANLTLENQGNANVKLNLSNINYTTSFIGGTNPGYAFKWDELESDATTCLGNDTDPYGLLVTDFGTENVWRNITVSMLNTTAAWCRMFNASDTADTLAISFRVLIPSNAPARTLEDIFTATAVALS